MNKEELLNYIIDFAINTEWMQIQRNDLLESNFYCFDDETFLKIA